MNFLNDVYNEMKEKEIKRAYIGKKMKKFVQNEEKEVGLIIVNDKEKYLHDFFIFYVDDYNNYEKLRDVENEFEEYSKLLENELVLLKINFPIKIKSKK